MSHITCQVLFFGAGIRYVPKFVIESPAFWLLLAVVIVGILLYQFMITSQKSNHTSSGTQFSFFSGRKTDNLPKIRYTSNGRSGQVWYQSREAEFAMYYEFGGGDCIASINIPGPEDWKKHTGLPLAQRDEVLHFIGQQVVKDQTTGGKGYFKVEGEWLSIMNNEK